MGLWVWLGFLSSNNQCYILSIKYQLYLRVSFNLEGYLLNFHLNLEIEKVPLFCFPLFMGSSGAQKEERLPRQPPTDGPSPQAGWLAALFPALGFGPSAACITDPVLQQCACSPTGSHPCLPQRGVWVRIYIQAELYLPEQKRMIYTLI